MYICICRAVTDRKIKDAINEGATSLDDLKQCLGVATCCGKCACSANHLLQAAQNKPGKP